MIGLYSQILIQLAPGCLILTQNVAGNFSYLLGIFPGDTDNSIAVCR